MPRAVQLAYQPRPWQAAAHKRKRRWNVLVWHRGAGKTAWGVAELVHEALSQPPIKEDPRRFAYIAPLRVQAQDVVWDRLLSHVAPIPGVTQHKQELRVTLPNGAIVQLYGADNPDRMRGITLDGVVRDEMAQHPPSLFPEVLLPALNRPGRPGWDVAVGTPKGRNTFCEVYERALKASQAGDDAYFADMQPVSRTNAIPLEQLASARALMTPEEYEQEFECSFSAAIVGAYFGREMATLQANGKLASLEYDPSLPVITAWDLGVGDDTVVWVVQRGRGGHPLVIDCIANNGVGLDWYVSALARKGYSLSETLLPHDAAARELIAGRSRVDTLRNLGMPRCRVLPRADVEDGINAARLLLPSCTFDVERCEKGIEALRQYRRDWDAASQVFRPRPRHDWTSHYADAFRCLAVGWQGERPAVRLSAQTPGWDAFEARPYRAMPGTVPDWNPYGEMAL